MITTRCTAAPNEPTSAFGGTADRARTCRSHNSVRMTRTRHARYTNEVDHLAPTKGMRPRVSLSAMLYVIELHRRRDEHGVACEAVVRWSETIPSQQGYTGFGAQHQHGAGWKLTERSNAG